jgi:hypothetical protein
MPKQRTYLINTGQKKKTSSYRSFRKSVQMQLAMCVLMHIALKPQALSGSPYELSVCVCVENVVVVVVVVMNSLDERTKREIKCDL